MLGYIADRFLLVLYGFRKVLLVLYKVAASLHR